MSLMLKADSCPFLGLQWSREWRAHSRSCSAGKYWPCSRELDGSAEKSSDLYVTCAPLVGFVFSVKRGRADREGLRSGAVETETK